MKFPSLKTIRKVLGKLTDLLLKGREAGLYDKKHGPPGAGGIER